MITRTAISGPANGAALILFLMTTVSGCFYVGRDDFDDVVVKPPDSWDTRDCITVILGAAVSNYADNIHNPGIRIVAIPFYPSVVAAIERREHLLGPLQYQPFTYEHTDRRFRQRLDSMLAIEAGVYLDWRTEKFVDVRGNYLRSPTQLDFLLFYLSMANEQIGPWNTAEPDISDLENRIFLINGAGDTLHPKYIAGRRNDRLVGEETLHIAFILRNGDSHFLAGSHEMKLEIDGFTEPVVFTFPLSRMR
ncbi:MAG TPA: hypothetical protein VMW43_01430 [Bacteroidota bacterium]|nr:hypothetical protein [Bacteroidota bacterium]